MQSFRFRLPFFSSDAPSRPTSGSAEAAPHQRPPFRPAGIAQPPKAVPPARDAVALPGPKSKGTSPGRRRSAETGATAAESVPPSSSAHQHKRSKSPSKKTEETKEERLLEESRQKNEIAKIDLVEKKSSVLSVQGDAEETEERRRKELDKAHHHHQEREDCSQSRIMGPLTAALESVRGARELLEAKIQGRQMKNERTEISESTEGFEIRNMTTSANPPESRRIKVDDSGENRGEAYGEGYFINRKIKEDIQDVVNKLTSGENNRINGEKPISVITLAGENRGAAMEIASEKEKKDDSIHIHRGYRSNPDESPYRTAVDVEGRSRFRGENQKEENPIKAYINSNNQSVNNSIILQGSVEENDPGVHMAVSTEEGKKENGEPENVEAKKSETTVTPAEKKTYEPRVRRRCLRGLFAESSESETENPQKPRRHGCRFRCKDKDIGFAEDSRT